MNFITGEIAHDWRFTDGCHDHGEDRNLSELGGNLWRVVEEEKGRMCEMVTDCGYPTL